jgi:hypothetical protein
MIEIELISAQDAASNITSVGLDLGDLQVYSVHANFTGSTLAGTLALEASNDNSDYATISGASQVIASAASHVFNVVNAAYRYVRLTWTQTGGTGNLTVKAAIKENPIKGA